MEKNTVIWTLVYTKAKQEIRAKKHLENQDFQVFLPIISIEQGSNKSRSEKLEVMFPRYIFVKLNQEDDWSCIRSTMGVSKIIFFGQRVAQVPYQLITYLQSKSDQAGVFKQKKIERDFQKGEKIIIKKGAFQGMEAIFVSKNSKSVPAISFNSLDNVNTNLTPVAASG